MGGGTAGVDTELAGGVRDEPVIGTKLVKLVGGAGLVP